MIKREPFFYVLISIICALSRLLIADRAIENEATDALKHIIVEEEENNIMRHKSDIFLDNEEEDADDLIKEAIAAVKEIEEKKKKIELKDGFGSAKPKEDDIADINLNLGEVSLASLVLYITKRTNLSIIPEKNLEQIKVSLRTEEPYTLEQALALLHTLLDKHGYSMIEVAGIQRIVPRMGAQQQPLPFYSSADGVEPEDLPDTDALIRYMYYLKNIKAIMARDILVNVLGDNTVEMKQDLDVIIMTQKSNSIKFGMKLIKELDQGGLRQAIKMIKLQHTDPEIIVRLFDEIIGRKQEQESIRFAAAAGKKESAYFSPNTKIIADSERFYLILMGQEHDIDRIIEFVKIFDRPDEADDSRLWTINLKYMEADRARALIERAIRLPQGTTDKQSLTSFKFFEDVVIAAETPKSGNQANYGSGNRLIIACNKEARPALKKLIDSIDKKYPQVAIEIMIVDVTQSLAKELSVQLRNKTADLINTGIDFHSAQAADSIITGENLRSNLASVIKTDAVPLTPQGAVFTIGDPGSSFENGNIWMYIRSLLNEKQTNILSQPFLIVNNREPCNIQSNELRRVDGDIVGATGIRGNLAKVDLEANTTINIVPRINADGVIDLTIDINLVDFLADSGTNSQPSRQVRRLNTRASMAEGQVLVLGGLNRTQQDQHFWHTPGFEKIPIFGNLFKGRQRTHTKRNLFIFIRPSIIKPRDEGTPDDYTQMKIDYAKYQVLNVDAYSGSKDPIQRWFFKPRNQDVKQRLKDVRAGIFRPIDDFKEGKVQPAEVNIKKDPYFQDSLKLAQYKQKVKSKRRKKIAQPRPEPIIFVKNDNKNRKKNEKKTSPVSQQFRVEGKPKSKSIFFKKPLENLPRRA
ncbi:hypothetical protein JKY79_01360 [Candidatus Babeliales bacterium]|nr:hypothetical protein [Candidatus Babeliales bacterium]